MNRYIKGCSARFSGLIVLGLVALSCATSAWAVPYASAVRTITDIGSGNTDFVLNEAADTVTITRDGGNVITINAAAAGRHSFDMAGFSTYEIKVDNSAAAGWTEISDAANLHTNFFRPNGVVVNQDPANEFFGTVYVSHPIELINNANFPQRDVGKGIYSLSADLIGVDLVNNLGVLANADDATLAKFPAAWSAGNNGSTPWQIALDDAGNVIASDFSDQSGGFKYADADLSSGGLVLAFEDGNRPLPVNGSLQEVHGSIISKPIVSGSIGNGLTIWGVDEDQDVDGETFNDDATANSLWRWDVGNVTSYDQPPTLEISSVAIDVPGTKWFSSVHGVTADAHFEPQHGKWYMTQSRTHGNEASLVIVSADGVDGTTPTIEWSSLQFTLDNGLDGAVGGATAANTDGVQDIFRSFGSVVISADGTKLFAHRAEQFNIDDASTIPGDNGNGDNPVLGVDGNSNTPGSIIVIPLDANGIPVIDIDDNGTPGDKSDDFITNFESITIGGQLSRHTRSPIALDAAGNVYITSNISELLQVFGPGGDTTTILTSAGTFTVGSGGGVALAGDYNNNGVVDAADYTVWLDNLGGSGLPNDATPGTVDQSDYDTWKAAFGSTLGSANSGSVPEPASCLLVLVCGMLTATIRRR